MSNALIFHPASQTPFEMIRDALESHLDLHRVEATTRARQHGGVLARGVPRARLEALRESLAGVGVLTRIVTDRDLDDMPLPHRATGIEFRDDTLGLVAPGGAETMLAHEDILGVRVWGLEAEAREQNREASSEDERIITLLRTTRADHVSAKEEKLDWENVEDAPDEGSPHVPPPHVLERIDAATLAERLGENGLADAVLFVTLYARMPPVSFRMRRDEIDFSGLGVYKTTNSLENFLVLLERLVVVLPESCDLTSLVGFLAGSDPRQLIRSNENEVANFDRWYLLWAMGRDGESEPEGLEP